MELGCLCIEFREEHGSTGVYQCVHYIHPAHQVSICRRIFCYHMTVQPHQANCIGLRSYLFVPVDIKAIKANFCIFMNLNNPVQASTSAQPEHFTVLHQLVLLI
ncbi:hypothetical protein BT93_I1086 [Corymbia citriodora subsp. variegata]|nr:hypothetical protein BT93_I1086 [Corymbia citriodora subsp. variegata]